MTIIRLLTLTLCLLLPSVSGWAMEHYTNVLFDPKGNSIKGATVYVYNTGTTTPAAIFSDDGITPKANPFPTSSSATSPGAYDFYAANGLYDLVFSKVGYTFNNALTRRISLFDVTTFSGGGGGGPTSFTDIFSGTNTTSTMTVGTGGTLTFSGSGILNASQFKGNGVIALADGGTNQTSWTASRCVRVNTAGTALEVASNDCNLTTPSFSNLTTGTNTTAAMTVGTGGSLTFSGSGSVNASLFKGNATVAVADGGTNLSSAIEDTTLIGNGTTWQAKVLPSCSNGTTSKLLYDASTNQFSCGTDQSGVSTFATLLSGTNASETFVVSAGASLTFSGSGTINASSYHGNATVAAADGGTGQTLTTDDGILLANGSTFQLKIIPECNNPTNSKLLYDSGANSFSCGVDQSAGGGTTFDTIGSGTNSSATMTVGTGGLLTLSGTGAVISNVNWPNVTTINAGNSPLSGTTTHAILFCDTTAAGRTFNLPPATNRVKYHVFNLGANDCTINRAGADVINTGLTSGTTFVIRNAGSNFWLQPDGSTTWYVGG